MHSSRKSNEDTERIGLEATSLIARARGCLEQAYARYSHYPVAAAVLDDRGQVFIGVNVENASYGLTMCAERVAIFSAIAAGAKRIVAVAVTSKSIKAVTPCGACRQVMAEFCSAVTPIYCDDGSDNPPRWTLGALLPEAFGAAQLGLSSGIVSEPKS